MSFLCCTVYDLLFIINDSPQHKVNDRLHLVHSDDLAHLVVHDRLHLGHSDDLAHLAVNDRFHLVLSVSLTGERVGMRPN